VATSTYGSTQISQFGESVEAYCDPSTLKAMFVRATDTAVEVTAALTAQRPVAVAEEPDGRFLVSYINDAGVAVIRLSRDAGQTWSDT
jgi:hypothetical protein